MENLKHAAQIAAANKQDDKLAALGMQVTVDENGSQRGQVETMPFDIVDREQAENDATIKAASIDDDDDDNSDGGHLNVNSDRAQNPQPKVNRVNAKQSMPNCN